MHCYRTLLTIGCAGLLAVGCAHKPKPMPMADTPSPDQLEMIRADYKTAFPNARVGVVTAVLGDSDYALISNLDTAGIAEGGYVTFLDAEQTVVANGRIVKVDPDGLTVKFDAGMRKVQVGDAAVKF